MATESTVVLAGWPGAVGVDRSCELSTTRVCIGWRAASIRLTASAAVPLLT